MHVDLNCDLGEGIGDDEAMLGIVSSASVACGFHAGDQDIMLRTARLAKQRGVRIGAHPSYPDRDNFGRTPMPGLSASQIEAIVAYQIGALMGVAALAGCEVTHVKAHGALSNVGCEDDMTARAIAAAIKAVDRDLSFVVLPNSALMRAGEAAGLKLVHEVYADRAYEDDAQLVSRSKPGAVLHDAGTIARRVARMVQDQAVTSVSGKAIKMPVDTVCIHGDTPGAVEIAREVRSLLEAQKIGIAPFV
ncbi:MAG: LamB/YcsF family protein [Bradyrhizobiaceae bacterium]|nr:MAG: LamB/YcsF family protein [Bradyrhizobiaceae bacterium]